MVTDFGKLVCLCDEELRHREYESKYYARITKQWECLQKWLNENNISEFNEEIGNRYCDEVFGTHVMPRRPQVENPGKAPSRKDVDFVSKKRGFRISLSQC